MKHLDGIKKDLSQTSMRKYHSGNYNYDSNNMLTPIRKDNSHDDMEKFIEFTNTRYKP